jgi:hypothetical protein
VEDEEFAKDIHEFVKNDRKVLLGGAQCDHFFFGAKTKREMGASIVTSFFSESMKESVGKRINPQVIC